jgi:hypothetical protein
MTAEDFREKLVERIASYTQDIKGTKNEAVKITLSIGRMEANNILAMFDECMKDVHPGPYPTCTDCGAVMVWDDVRKDSPVWMCPACVLGRCKDVQP